MQPKKIEILKVLVGSQSHGLQNEDSDFDYRAVYVNQTTDILSIGHKYKGNHWVEGEKEDQTAYEIGHFLKLATRSNPTILEVLRAPVIKLDWEKELEESDSFNPEWRGDDFGNELRQLFPYLWNPNDAYNAFVGYSSNQRKKMLDNKDDRGPKFAVAYLRTLYNLKNLLHTGTFDLKIPNGSFKERLLKIKGGDFKVGYVINEAEDLIECCRILKDTCKQEPDLEKVHEFLMKVRKQYWTI